MNKDVKRYQRDLQRRGYRVLRGTNHSSVYHPAGGKALTTLPSSPSDWRWRENCESQLRKALQEQGLQEPVKLAKEATMASPLPRGHQQRLHEILRHIQEELGTKSTKNKKYGYGTMVRAGELLRELSAKKGHTLHRAEDLSNDALAQRLRAAVGGKRLSSGNLGDVVWFIETFEDTVTAPAPEEPEAMAEPAPVIEMHPPTSVGTTGGDWPQVSLQFSSPPGPDHEPIRALMRMLAIVQPAMRQEALEQANVIYNALTGATEVAAAAVE